MRALMTQAQLLNALVATGLVAIGLALALLLRAIIARGLRLWSSRFMVGVRGRLLATGLERPAAAVVSSVVFWLVFIFFIATAAETIGVPVVSTSFAAMVGYLPRVAATVLVVLLGLLLASLARHTVAGSAASAGIADAELLGRVVQALILGVTAVVSFDQLGIEITFIVVTAAIVIGATLGGAALAFGLGARTAVSNIIASYYLLKTYRVGQRVRIGDLEGRIAEITATAVLLDTAGGRVLVPAKEFSERTSVLLAEEG